MDYLDSQVKNLGSNNGFWQVKNLLKSIGIIVDRNVLYRRMRKVFPKKR